MVMSEPIPSRRPLQVVSPNASSSVIAAPPTKCCTPGPRPSKTGSLKGPRDLHVTNRQNNDRNETFALTSLEHVKDQVHDFEDTCQLWADNYKITKIAQGGFAAIFSLQLRADTANYVIAKLMPLKSKTRKGSRAASFVTIQDAATEVKALDAMSEIPGFVGFSEAWVLKGALPALFEEESRTWAQTHPEDGVVKYSKDQLWCFIEMTDAGTDLEHFLAHGFLNHHSQQNLGKPRPLSAFQCWDIFWSIAEALGRGEEFAEFEHRDLHPGNVCIKEATLSGREADELILHKKYTNLEVTLIDYTLSRATLASGEVLAHLMTDKSIFDQHVENPHSQQEKDDDQQYEMYRIMRRLVTHKSSGSKKDADGWRSFVPQTNVLWLYHILSILLKRLRTHSKANKQNEPTKTRNDQRHLTIKATTGCTETPEERQVQISLTQLMDELYPNSKHKDSSKYGSAKALLECQQYWMDEAYEILEHSSS